MNTYLPIINPLLSSNTSDFISKKYFQEFNDYFRQKIQKNALAPGQISLTKQIVLDYVNLFFGPTGPGYNYLGVTSFNYNYFNNNNLPELNPNTINYFRSLYYTNTLGLTFANEKINQLNSSLNVFFNSTAPINPINPF